jgi:hypothetical protein
MGTGLTIFPSLTEGIIDGGGGASIGGTVTGGLDGRILYIHPDGVLAQDSNFLWDGSTQSIGGNLTFIGGNRTITTDIAATSRSLTINPATPTNSNAAGGAITIRGGSRNGINTDGAVNIESLVLGTVNIKAGTSGTTGGTININAGGTIAGGTINITNTFAGGININAGATGILKLNNTSTGAVISGGNTQYGSAQFTARGDIAIGNSTNSATINFDATSIDGALSYFQQVGGNDVQRFSFLSSGISTQAGVSTLSAGLDSFLGLIGAFGLSAFYVGGNASTGALGVVESASDVGIGGGFLLGQTIPGQASQPDEVLGSVLFFGNDSSGSNVSLTTGIFGIAESDFDVSQEIGIYVDTGGLGTHISAWHNNGSFEHNIQRSTDASWNMHSSLNDDFVWMMADNGWVGINKVPVAYDLEVNGDIQAGGYRSSDASAGINTTITTASLVGKTITVKNGLITGFA